MAVDVFPIYEVLVENVFGGVGIALVGVALAMVLILFMGRVSRVFIMYWLLFYTIVALSFYLGAIGLILGFILSLIWFWTAVIRSVFREA